MKEQVSLEIHSEVKSEVKKYAKDPEYTSVLKETNLAVVTLFSNEGFYVQLPQKCPRLCLSLTSTR